MKKLLFIYNPHSGKGKITSNLDKIKSIFEKFQYEATLYPTKAPLDGKEYVSKVANSYDLIVCSGGDGTINEIASGIFLNNIKRP